MRCFGFFGVAAALATAGVLFTSTTAGAVPLLTFAYEGVITNADPDGAPVTPEFATFVGQTLRFEFTFDAGTADTNPNAGAGNYVGAVTSASVAAGAKNYVHTAAGRIVIFDDSPNDDFFVSVPITGPTIGGLPVGSILLALSDMTDAALTNDDLPLTPPDPADFSPGFSFLQIGLTNLPTAQEPRLLAVGNLTAELVQAASIPEPGSLLLLASGLAGLGFAARRRSRAAA